MMTEQLFKTTEDLVVTPLAKYQVREGKQTNRYKMGSTVMGESSGLGILGG